VASASIESVIIAAIKPAIQQVSDRITPVKRDDNGVLPAVVYESGMAQRAQMLSGTFSDIATVNIQFTVFARTYLSAKELLSQLDTALIGSRGFSMSGLSILATETSGVTEQNESDSDNLFSASLVAIVKFK
jgi:hypothetical protein